MIIYFVTMIKQNWRRTWMRPMQGAVDADERVFISSLTGKQGNVPSIVYFLAVMEIWLEVVNVIQRNRRSWSYILRSTDNGVNEEMTPSLGGSCTEWLHNSAFPAMDDDSSLKHGDNPRKDLTLDSAILLEWWTRKKEGAWTWEE